MTNIILFFFYIDFQNSHQIFDNFQNVSNSFCFLLLSMLEILINNDSLIIEKLKELIKNHDLLWFLIIYFVNQKIVIDVLISTFDLYWGLCICNLVP